MSPASEHDLAFSMMRLWGKGARRLARNYARDSFCKDDV
jgi:hypothetical protein